MMESGTHTLERMVVVHQLSASTHGFPPHPEFDRMLQNNKSALAVTLSIFRNRPTPILQPECMVVWTESINNTNQLLNNTTQNTQNTHTQSVPLFLLDGWKTNANYSIPLFHPLQTKQPPEKSSVRHWYPSTSPMQRRFLRSRPCLPGPKAMPGQQ